MPAHNPEVQKTFRGIAERRGINLILGAAALGVKGQRVLLEGGREVPCDEVSRPALLGGGCRGLAGGFQSVMCLSSVRERIAASVLPMLGCGTATAVVLKMVLLEQ